MSDWNELKARAEAATNAHWHEDDLGCALEFAPLDGEDQAFMLAASPAAVLGLIAENEALRKDADIYRFVSQLAWYVDRAAQVYDLGNQSSPWLDDRRAVDADEVEAALIAAMGKGVSSDD